MRARSRDRAVSRVDEQRDEEMVEVEAVADVPEESESAKDAHALRLRPVSDQRQEEETRENQLDGRELQGGSAHRRARSIGGPDQSGTQDHAGHEEYDGDPTGLRNGQAVAETQDAYDRPKGESVDPKNREGVRVPSGRMLECPAAKDGDTSNDRDRQGEHGPLR
jgi:hypothetical protein